MNFFKLVNRNFSSLLVLFSLVWLTYRLGQALTLNQFMEMNFDQGMNFIRTVGLFLVVFPLLLQSIFKNDRPLSDQQYLCLNAIRTISYFALLYFATQFNNRTYFGMERAPDKAPVLYWMIFAASLGTALYELIIRFIYSSRTRIKTWITLMLGAGIGFSLSVIFVQTVFYWIYDQTELFSMTMPSKEIAYLTIKIAALSYFVGRAVKEENSTWRETVLVIAGVFELVSLIIPIFSIVGLIGYILLMVHALRIRIRTFNPELILTLLVILNQLLAHALPMIESANYVLLLFILPVVSLIGENNLRWARYSILFGTLVSMVVILITGPLGGSWSTLTLEPFQEYFTTLLVALLFILLGTFLWIWDGVLIKMVEVSDQ